MKVPHAVINNPCRKFYETFFFRIQFNLWNLKIRIGPLWTVYCTMDFSWSMHLGDSSAIPSAELEYIVLECMDPQQILCGAGHVSVNHWVFAFNRELMPQSGRGTCKCACFVQAFAYGLHVCIWLFSIASQHLLLWKLKNKTKFYFY